MSGLRIDERCQGCGHTAATHDARCYQPGCACEGFVRWLARINGLGVSSTWAPLMGAWGESR